MPMFKGERQRQMTLFAQLQLLNDLETLNPLEHDESMRETAKNTFYVLNRMSINYNHVF